MENVCDVKLALGSTDADLMTKRPDASFKDSSNASFESSDVEMLSM